jgi:hypothetical protein
MVALVDLSRSLLVEELLPQTHGVATSTLLVATQPNIVGQVLFNPAGTRLLVSTASCVCRRDIAAVSKSDSVSISSLIAVVYFDGDV